MNKSLSIAIVGNCQARPLAQIIQSLVPYVNITGIAIVHLLHDAQQPEYAPIFESADLILAQRVTDNYHCSFVRNAELRNKYGDRVRVWPNLYYAGYNPELFYIRGEARKPLRGPMGDYHSKTIFDAWRRGLNIDEAMQLHHNDDYNSQAYGDIPNKSLEELRKREEETDVRIVEWIVERMWRQRLFFTFNHPAQVLIRELGRRLVQAAGVNMLDLPDASINQHEPLGQYRCSINPWVAKYFNCKFNEPEIIKGNEVLSVDGGKVVTGKLCSYQSRQIVEEFFRVYDACNMSLRV